MIVWSLVLLAFSKPTNDAVNRGVKSASMEFVNRIREKIGLRELTWNFDYIEAIGEDAELLIKKTHDNQSNCQILEYEGHAFHGAAKMFYCENYVKYQKWETKIGKDLATAAIDYWFKQLAHYSFGGNQVPVMFCTPGIKTVNRYISLVHANVSEFACSGAQSDDKLVSTFVCYFGPQKIPYSDALMTNENYEKFCKQTKYAMGRCANAPQIICEGNNKEDYYDIDDSAGDYDDFDDHGTDEDDTGAQPQGDDNGDNGDDDDSSGNKNGDRKNNDKKEAKPTASEFMLPTKLAKKLFGGGPRKCKGGTDNAAEKGAPGAESRADGEDPKGGKSQSPINRPSLTLVTLVFLVIHIPIHFGFQ